MAPAVPTSAVVGTTVAFSFILLGNAITQSFMGVPALLVDFPRPGSSSPATYEAATRHLGRQWPVFWSVGNVFFRPISTLGIFGYAYAAWSAATAAPSVGSLRGLANGNIRGAVDGGGYTWKLYALSAVCHLVTVVHSAVNMQPLNNKLDGLSDPKVSGVDASLAEYYARRWIKLNGVRIVMPFVAGSVALWNGLRGQTA
ncbi:hypothetical protein B0T17DRAFT_593034 [Bombardia bombarda]|uniref:Uncharacterized protein n=1 Tax=Bombardia bombarda TaxID=252184 RepID=A0AA39WH59_9PEZI|nr:hypothetical protein B0T17DRAFT_593034 [Bombardia bombarda]